MLEPVPDSECVIFKGHLDNKGYGRFRASEHAKEMGLSKSEMVKAHRFIYFLVRGNIPDERGLVFSPDLEVDHKCRNTSCGGNAYHYQLLTKSENTSKGNLDRRIDNGGDEESIPL